MKRNPSAHINRPPLIESERVNIIVVSISRLARLCRVVAPHYSDRARIIEVRQGYGDAVEAVQTYVDSGTVDVVLAAGSNGAFLRERLGLPVVTVKFNAFDILSAFTRAAATCPGGRVGLVLHEAIAIELDEFRPLLNFEIVQRAYRGADDVHRVVAELAALGCTVVIGPGKVCDIAEQAGLQTMFLYSVRAVEEAFDHAIELAQLSRNKEAERMRLNTIIEHLRDGVAAFDQAGVIEACNPAMLDLLGLGQAAGQAALSGAMAQFLPGAGLADDAAEERIFEVKGRALIVNCIPILEWGTRAGSIITVQDAQAVQRTDRNIRTSQRAPHTVARHYLSDLTGESPEIARVRRTAQASAAYDATVLLTGESGTGKELVAQGIHNASKRRGNPFVAFNCAALPEGLIESELFGYEDGAFSGARRSGKPGLFEIAHTGTIFLDEIGEMPPALQSRLLRVLQEREILKLGSSRPTPIDVHVIAATHRDLNALVKQGVFRSDLYFRLNLFHISLPALRERRADLPHLARHMLGRIVRRYGLDPDISDDVMQALAPLFADYEWPGNVRELENLLTRAAIQRSIPDSEADDDIGHDFPEFKQVAPRPPTQETPARTQVTLQDLLRTIEQCGGNRAAASRQLGIGRTTLWRMLRQQR